MSRGDGRADPMIEELAGNYRLVAKLGSGGMGDVYKGVHTTIGSRVAIKVLHSAATREPDGERRFLREAQAVNRIEHEGIIKVLDAGRLDDGRPFLVMELLEGSSLDDLQRAGPIPLPEACRIVIDVLDAVAAAHAVGVVHRDLKPPNIFRTRSGRVVVLDFGIAKLMDPGAAARITSTGAALGTPHYMAPEQINDGPIGPATDVYATGIVLFELLCGRRPFEGDDVADVINGHLERRPPPPRALRPELSIALSDVLLTALAKAPHLRHASAAAMRDALRTAVAAGGLGPVAATPVVAHRIAEPATVTTPHIAERAAPPTAQTVRGTRPRSEPIAARPSAALTIPRQRVAALDKTTPDGTPAAVVAIRAKSRKRAIGIAIGVIAALVVSWLVVRAPARQPAAIVSDASLVAVDRSPIPTRAAHHDAGVDGNITIVESSMVRYGDAPRSTHDRTHPYSDVDAGVPITGLLTIESEPSGVDVQIDGAQMGQTPWHGVVKPRRTTVVVLLSAPGFNPLAKVVRVGPGSVQTIKLTLAKPTLRGNRDGLLDPFARPPAERRE